METNLDLGGGGGCSSSLDYVLSVPNGVIWFFLASSAEVTPAVSPAGFIAPLFFPHYFTLQVFASLNLNGSLFFRPI